MISIIGMQFYLAGSLENVQAFAQNMVTHHTMMLLYGWPGLIATMAIIPVVYFLYKRDSKVAVQAKLAFAITLVGLTFIIVGYMFHLALTYFHAPLFPRSNEENSYALEYVFKTTIGLQDMFWLCGDLFAFLGIACIIILGAKESVIPKHLNFIGIFASLLASIGSFGFIPAFKSYTLLSLMFISGFSLFALWEIWLGILLIRGKGNKVNLI